MGEMEIVWYNQRIKELEAQFDAERKARVEAERLLKLAKEEWEFQDQKRTQLEEQLKAAEEQLQESRDYAQHLRLEIQALKAALGEK